jgi:hypothetical protein
MASSYGTYDELELLKSTPVPKSQMVPGQNPSITSRPNCLACEEPLLKSAGIPIPEGAGSNKSFSLKPIPGSIEGAASLGILFLDCTLGEELISRRVLTKIISTMTM